MADARVTEEMVEAAEAAYGMLPLGVASRRMPDALEAALAHLPPDPEKQELQVRVEELRKANKQMVANLHERDDAVSSWRDAFFKAQQQSDQLTAKVEQLREGLEAIADGEGDAGEIACQTLEAASTQPKALSKRDEEVLALMKAAEPFIARLNDLKDEASSRDPLLGHDDVLIPVRWLLDIESACNSTQPKAQAIVERIRDEERAKLLPTNAALDVLNERQRQKSVEGWSEARDDSQDRGELSRAAACYALEATKDNHIMTADACGEKPVAWPWDSDWWKPANKRRSLVKAGALILAEIERLDRASKEDE